MKIAIYLDAGHTTSGNPRRVFVVIDEQANVVDTIDEGYEGVQALYKRHGKIPVTGRFDTSAREYRELIKRQRDTERQMLGTPRFRRSR